jgi:hypothetical protein
MYNAFSQNDADISNPELTFNSGTSSKKDKDYKYPKMDLEGKLYFLPSLTQMVSGQNPFLHLREDCSKVNQCRNFMIEIRGDILSIGDFAFSWCTSIQSLTIPSSVLSIGMNPFLYDNLTLHNNSCLYEIENKTLYTIGKKFLIACLSKELSFQIPDEVTRIGQHAFYGCPFRQLYIHDNIKQIGKDAFDGCYYEAFPYGYSMKILVSKGAY